MLEIGHNGKPGFREVSLSGLLAGAGDRCGVSGLFRHTLLAAADEAADNRRTTMQNKGTGRPLDDRSTCRVSATDTSRELRLLHSRYVSTKWVL